MTPTHELFRKFVLASEAVVIPEGYELLDWQGQTCFPTNDGVRMGLISKSAKRRGWGVLWLWQTISDNNPDKLAEAVSENLLDLSRLIATEESCRD